MHSHGKLLLFQIVVRTGISSCIAPPCWTCSAASRGGSLHHWRIPSRAPGFWCSKVGGYTRPRSSLGKAGLFRRQTKKMRVQTTKSITFLKLRMDNIFLQAMKYQLQSLEIITFTFYDTYLYCGTLIQMRLKSVQEVDFDYNTN